MERRRQRCASSGARAAKSSSRHLGAGHADDRELLRQLVALGQRGQRGIELAGREVAGGPEDDERSRRARPWAPSLGCAIASILRSAARHPTRDGSPKPSTSTRTAAAEWAAARRPAAPGPTSGRSSPRSPPGAVRVDLGCGPGRYTARARRTGRRARRRLRDAATSPAPPRPTRGCVQADLEALPFRPQSLGGAWAQASYLHVPQATAPARARASSIGRSVAGAPLALAMMRGRLLGPRTAGRRLPRPVLRVAGNRTRSSRSSKARASTVDRVRRATDDWIHGAGHAAADPARLRRPGHAHPHVRAQPEPALRGRRARLRGPEQPLLARGDRRRAA